MSLVLGLLSIILTIVAFYWVLLLTQRIKALEEAETTYNLVEIQEQLDAHLKAVREENVRFINEMEERSEKQATELPSHQKPTAPTPIDTAPSRSQQSSLLEEKPMLEWEPPVNLEEPIDVMETSLMSRILQLKQEGLNTEVIAKQLDLGKGEVALMLKLHEKR